MPTPAAGPTAERRLASVLFADLVGFTTLGEQSDPEEVRELLSGYFAVARTVLQRHGGTIEKFIGDAVMAVFGVPVAAGDDAERAVRAGLELVDAVAAFGERHGIPDLMLRAGVLSGEMAVSLGAVGEGMVAGDAVNTAARIQAAATPGEVWVDEVTRTMTAAAVRYRDAGEHTLKGKAAPVHLWAAVDVAAPVGGGGTRIDGLEAPWTGRDHELRLVKDLFHAALDDERPRMIVVSGVAGIGKTRLGWEFDKYVDGLLDVVAWHRARVLSYGDGLTFWPIAEMVRVRLGIDDDVDGDEAATRLDDGLRELVERPDERDWLRPRIAVLLGLDLGTGSTPFPRSELFAAWTVFFDHVARSRHGAVLLLDDLEHAEPGLLDFLDHLLEASSAGLVVLACTRPTLLERRPGWGTTPRATVLHLEPLSDAAMRRLVDGLVDGLTDEYRDALVARAAGIPLYAMELVRALIDRDVVVPREGRYVVADATALVLDDVAAPPTLVALIAARLDALTVDERRLVHDAAVIGESFDRDELLMLTDVAEPLGVLDELVRKQVLTLQVDRFSSEVGQYRFVQGLVRTVAYDTLSRRDRKARHLAVARRLLEQGDEVVAIAARHHLDAIDAVPDDPDVDELIAVAVDLLARAARRAEEVGSSDEALRLLQDALARAPEADERPELLEAAALAARHLGRHDESLDLAQQAVEAWRTRGSELDVARATASMAMALHDVGQLQATIDVAGPLHEAFSGRPDAAGVVVALCESLYRAHANLGDHAAAATYARQGLRLAEGLEDAERTAAFMARVGNLDLATGSPLAGLAMLRAAVEVGRANDRPQATAVPLMALTVSLLGFSPAEAQTRVEELKTLAERTGQVALRTGALLNAALVFASIGRWDELLAIRLPEGAIPYDHLDLRRQRFIALWGRGEPETLPAVTPDEAADENLGTLSALATLDFFDAVRAGDRDGARTHGLRAMQIENDHPPLAAEYHWTFTRVTEGLLALDDLTTVEELLPPLEAHLRGLWSPLLRTQHRRVVGTLRTRSGDPAAGEPLLRQAVEELAAFGLVWDLAQARLHLGSALHDLGRAEEAVTVLAESREGFAALGAVPWVARADAAANEAMAV